uniref:G domain-containing protein n=1 Tax=Periophthalmus magnuspinnatus TaxID=409849 RepID=A0A3B4A827_9GOBI
MSGVHICISVFFAVLDKPWREIDWGQKDNLLKFLKTYKPKGASHLRILLYGPVGAGKSSFINSAASVIKGTLVNMAGVEGSNMATQSFTFKTHKIRTDDGTKIPIVFNDIMGLEARQSVGVRPEDIYLAMKGHVKDGYRFDPKKALSPEDDEYNKNPSVDDKVHVLVCLLKANATDISDHVLEKMMEVKEMARDLGKIYTHAGFLSFSFSADIIKCHETNCRGEETVLMARGSGPNGP